MNRRLGARLARLEEVAPKSTDPPMCVYHRDVCQMGAQPLPELYVLVVEAKRRVGQVVPPLDEHRAMTAAERVRDAREFAALLAETRERVAAEEAALKAGAPWT
ncbi:hypothetical protein Sipo8835_00070 [Streptomyces ipomoeae]|uniref:Uncharacterized protein n=1 Tax=Streptomyces ipomoeae TaxID=103232 RepID=A0AAE8WA60_9ACTN|nr:hypothetical protein [Streptomyces ipomoeae]TQE40242.1 hypothetical protein Sipo8835_00070 [Streptomyces ipomoeae]